MADTTPSIPLSAREELGALAARAQDLNHDFRTPIGTMATALELLRAGGTRFSDEDLETLDVLQRQVAKLTTLARSLHDFACELEAQSRGSLDGPSTAAAF